MKVSTCSESNTLEALRGDCYAPVRGMLPMMMMMMMMMMMIVPSYPRLGWCQQVDSGCCGRTS